MADGPKSSAGRNKKKCDRYMAEHRADKNKASRLFKHIVKCCDENMDQCAHSALKPISHFLSKARIAILKDRVVL